MNPICNSNQNHPLRDKSCKSYQLKEESLFLAKILKGKAYEAEDAPFKNRFPLKRQLSVPNILKTFSLEPTKEKLKLKLKKTWDDFIEEKTAPKNGEIWDCIDCELDTYGGNIYTFQIKPEYDILRYLDQNLAFIEKNLKIYPATEKSSLQLASYFLDTKRYEDFIENFFQNGQIEKAQQYMALYEPIIKIRKELKSLKFGFEMDESGTYLMLPDEKSLTARWNLLRDRYPDLKPIHIKNSKGIASDTAFIESYFTHDALLSSGKEFIHDHTVHLIPTIAFMLTRESGELVYPKDKFKLVKLVIQNYRKLEIAKKLCDTDFTQMLTTIGAFVDGLSSNPKSWKRREFFEMTKNIIQNNLTDFTSSFNPWILYWNRRFGKEHVLTQEKMKEIWVFVNDIVGSHDRNLKKWKTHQ